MNNDIVKRLVIKADMMEMADYIPWGNDTALMREAADVITNLRLELEAMQWRPIETVNKYDRPVYSGGFILGASVTKNLEFVGSMWFEQANRGILDHHHWMRYRMHMREHAYPTHWMPMPLPPPKPPQAD